VSRISGFPTALLSLLGSQNFGQAPNELGPTIAPCVDVGDLFALTAQTTANASIAAIVNGPNVGAAERIQVPQGEVWRIYQISAFVATGVGATLTHYLQVVAGQNQSVTVSEAVAQVASTARFNIAKLTAPLWLQAGNFIQLYAADVVGAAPGSVTAIVQRFRG
jgi:hypothetical protein